MQAVSTLARAAGLLAFATTCHAANLVKDGGFEQPLTPAGSYNLYSTGQKFGPWTVVGASGNVATVATNFSQNGFTFQAKTGKAFLDLTGVSNTPTGVQQIVKTTPGTSYTLTFWVGNVVNPGGIFGTATTVDVYNGGTLLLAATTSLGQGSGKQSWKKFTTSFVATTSKTTLAFINGDPSNDTACSLDTVTLLPTP